MCVTIEAMSLGSSSIGWDALSFGVASASLVGATDGILGKVEHWGYQFRIC